MTTEVEQAVEQTVEVNEDHSSSDSDFEAGFAAARGEEPPVATEEPPVEVEPAPEPEPEPQPEPEPDPVALLKEEIANLKNQLQHNNDKVFGKIGEAFRELQTLKQAKPAGVELTEADLADAFEDYPEMRRDFLKAMNAANKKRGVTQPEEPAAPMSQAFDPAEVERIAALRANEAAEAVRKQMALERLEDQHADWKDVVKDQKWGQWISKQPPEVQEQAANSWDVRFVTKLLSDYKASLTRKETSKKRLESAVTPQGVATDGPPATTEEERFNAGFSRVNQRRF